MYKDNESIKIDYKSQEGKLILESIFRKDPENNLTRNILRENYFNEKNFYLWKRDYEILKENFIKELKVDVNQFKSTMEYNSSFSMGYVNMTGLTINFTEDSYIHYLPDFKLAINYMINLSPKTDEMLDDINEFSINSIKAFHHTFGVDYNYKYSEYNSEEDILMALKKSDFTKSLSFDTIEDNSGQTAQINSTLGLRRGNKQKNNKSKMLNFANLPLNSIYQFDFRNVTRAILNDYRLNTEYNSYYENSKGITFKKNGNPSSQNYQIMYWNLGYFNFYIDLDQIIVAARDVDEKEFIVFS
ncbi:hypothetical protein [Spiroplasma endosymbiont of Cantharis lateralis]|uniref:hypothetical protein n=1 Tax=Spiroplasma endosymbiont of Cantharis lateralis TaxID=3066277 RepID=UPI00313B32AD